MNQTEVARRPAGPRTLLCTLTLTLSCALLLALAACGGSSSAPAPAGGTGGTDVAGSKLIGSDENGNVWLLNATTGAASRLLEVQEEEIGHVGATGLEYMPALQAFFASSQNGSELYRVALETGTAIYQGTFAWYATDLALNPSGDLLYGIGNGDGNELDVWDLAGRISNRISWLDLCCNGGALTFADAKLYLAMDETLYQLDETDGTTLATIAFQYVGEFTAIDPAFPSDPALISMVTLADGSVIGILEDGSTSYLVNVNVTNGTLTLIAQAPEGIGSLAALPPTVTLPQLAPNAIQDYGTLQGLWSVHVQWVESFLATSYKIFWSTNPGIDIANPSTYGGVYTAAATPYYDDLAATGLTYYVVVPRNPVGMAPTTPEFSGTPGADLQVGNLALTEQLGSVLLLWDSLAGAATYTVYRAGTGFDPVTQGSPIATGVGSPSYRDSTVVDATTYNYAVRGVNANGTGLPSITGTIDYFGDNFGPSFLTAEARFLAMRLTWDTLPGATSYNLYWNTTGTTIDPAVPVTYQGSSIGLTAPRFNHAGLNDSLTYHYAVTGVNSFATPAKESATTTAQAMPLGAPPGFGAQIRGTNALTWKWDAVIGATQYNLFWNSSGAAIDPTIPSSYNGSLQNLTGTTLDAAYPTAVGAQYYAASSSNGVAQSHATAPVGIPQYLGAEAIAFAPMAHGAGSFLSLSDDQVSGTVNIGFTFKFFGVDQTQLQVSSNGFVTFGTGNLDSGCCSGGDLPWPYIGDMIALTWTDLYPPGGGSVQFETMGSPGSRVFVLTFNAVPQCCNGIPFVTTQLQLFETSNLVEVHTSSLTGGSRIISQGVVNADGTIGIILPGRSQASFDLASDAVRFYTNP